MRRRRTWTALDGRTDSCDFTWWRATVREGPLNFDVPQDARGSDEQPWLWMRLLLRPSVTHNYIL